MFHLLQPIWLAAIAAISVPVAVHLWNDRRGKVLRIGSVALLSDATRRLAWSRRITEWLLLVLRCLLLVVLAILLAGPYWTRPAAVGKGWVLVEGSGGSFAPVIDSLVKAGYERHDLGGGGNNWAGFREADTVAAKGLKFYVFSTALVGRFSGLRPSTEREVHWEVYAPVDSMAHWVQRAWLSPGDSVLVLEGSSRATGTLWRRRERFSGEDVKVDTAAIRVRVVADGSYKEDGKYVEAALKALQRVTGRRIVSDDGGWLFWLSDRPMKAEGYTHVWCYAQGKEVVVDTWMEGVHLSREIASAGEALWRDGFGRAVLSQAGKVFRFYSRLDPNWGDLVWSSRLPVLLGELILPAEEAGRWDRRVLDVAQILPAKLAGLHRDARMKHVDLRPAVWVLLLGLFLMERIKASRDAKA